MKIAVIGTFVNDTIHPYQEPVKKSLGGITYTIPYLAKLAGPEWEIWPICVVGKDIYDKVLKLLAPFQNVRTEGIRVIDQENTKVTLVYTSKLVREEYTTDLMPPIDKAQLEFAVDADICLTNFITGNELRLEDLHDLAARAKGLIYMDYHQLAWQDGENGKRVPWRREDWREWIKVVDVLQMNELEGGILSGNGLDASISDLEEFGLSAANEFEFIFNLTLGDQGSLLFFKQEGEVVSKHLQASKIWTVHDPTGCGDAFASAFLISYSREKDALKAALYANRVAGFNCSFSGIQKLDELWSEFLKSEQ